MTIKTILTTDPEYQNILEKYNQAILDFIENNPKLVEYDKEDGTEYSTITLEYGTVRDKLLQEIAENVNETLNDASFKINDIRCELIYANSAVLRFRGKTSEIETDLRTIANDSSENSEKLKNVYKSLIFKSDIENDIDLNQYVEDLEKFFKKYVLNKSKQDEMLLSKSGFVYKTFGSKGYFGINVKDLSRCDELKAEYNVIVKPLLRVYKNNPDLINIELDKKLATIGIDLERINEYSIMFSYKLTKYNEDIVKKDFNYRTIPGAITRIFVHIGKAGTISTNDILHTDANYEFIDPEATPVDNAEESIDSETGEFLIDADGAVRSKDSSDYARLNEVYESVVVECNIRMTDTYIKVLNTLKNDIKFRKLIDVDIDPETGKFIVAEEPKYFTAEYFTESNDNNSVFDYNWNNALWISDSTLAFNKLNFYNESGTNTALIQDFGDSTTFENFDTLSEEDLNSSNSSSSSLHNGVSIIKKAIETGRALDICIPYKELDSDEGFYYSDSLTYLKSAHDNSGDK